MYVKKYAQFLHVDNLPLFRPWVLSRGLGCVAYTEGPARVCTLRRKFELRHGPGSMSVARALDVQSRGKLALLAFSGIAFRPARAKASPTPTSKLSWSRILLHLLLLWYFRSTTAAFKGYIYIGGHDIQQPHASSFSLRDSHERCFCVCVRERACVYCHQYDYYKGT